MTTGFDIQLWNTCLQKAKENGLELDVKGDKFRIYYKEYSFIGILDTVKEVFVFLCGYENGLIVGGKDIKCKS